jgi:hypothetical protein
MGLDRFANFITKSINNNGIEEIYLNNNIKKVVASHVIFDLNFLIYQEIISIENEINDIIKIILCLPYSINKSDIIENLLKTIFTQSHWKPYYVETDLQYLCNGNNEDEIIKQFLNYITTKIVDNNISIIDMVIYQKIVNMIIYNINEIHHVEFIKSLLIFFDGMPSVSKIIEQRRRRIKNHMESNQKKVLFKKYFDNMEHNNVKLFENLSKNYNINLSTNDDNIILFDYFKWIKKRYNVDKSLGPSTVFIKNLEQIIKIQLQKLLPTITIYIDSAQNNGESDLKIFKYISSECNVGDFSIHTMDSDLIYQSIVQQTYYKIIGVDINMSVIKYLKLHTTQSIIYDNNPINYAQIIDANIVIQSILELYNTTNFTKSYNYKIIWDLCILFLFFGNDHLPSSLEISPELGMEYFAKKHFQALGKNNIININKTSNDWEINIILKNLLLLLDKINENKKNNITKIILQRYFKINNNMINLLVDRFSLDFIELQKFMHDFIVYRALQLSPEDFDKLPPYDLRKVLVLKIPHDMIDKYRDINCMKLNDTNKKLLLDSIKLLEDNIEYNNMETNQFIGLIQYNKPFIVTKDKYQDMYNFISDKATQILMKQYPILYDYIDITNHINLLQSKDYNVEDYIKKLIHLITTQFGSMKNFHTDNITFYRYNCIPPIEEIILYLKTIPDNMITIWNEMICADNIIATNYLNPINHHLLISPFVLHTSLPENIRQIVTKLEEYKIDNLWFNNENTYNNFNYRNLDIKKFIESWKIVTENIMLLENKI